MNSVITGIRFFFTFWFWPFLLMRHVTNNEAEISLYMWRNYEIGKKNREFILGFINGLLFIIIVAWCLLVVYIVTMIMLYSASMIGS